jgi:hypothetical protein
MNTPGIEMASELVCLGRSVVAKPFALLCAPCWQQKHLGYVCSMNAV